MLCLVPIKSLSSHQVLRWLLNRSRSLVQRLESCCVEQLFIVNCWKERNVVKRLWMDNGRLKSSCWHLLGLDRIPRSMILIKFYVLGVKVLVQLLERSLLTSKICSSNRVIGQLLWKDENLIKRRRIVHLTKILYF